MAKKKGNLFGATVEYTKTQKGTSIGRRGITSTLNKHKSQPEPGHKWAISTN